MKTKKILIVTVFLVFVGTIHAQIELFKSASKTYVDTILSNNATNLGGISSYEYLPVNGSVTICSNIMFKQPVDVTIGGLNEVYASIANLSGTTGVRVTKGTNNFTFSQVQSTYDAKKNRITITNIIELHIKNISASDVTIHYDSITVTPNKTFFNTMNVAPVTVNDSCRANGLQVSNEVISVFPNPTDGFLNVSSSDVSSLSLYDLSGKLAKRVFNTNIIDITSVSAGMYVLQISFKSTTNIRTAKVVKNR